VSLDITEQAHLVPIPVSLRLDAELMENAKKKKSENMTQNITRNEFDPVVDPFAKSF